MNHPDAEHNAFDGDLLIELTEASQDPPSAERDELIAEIAAEAEANGYLHTRIMAHAIMAIDMRQINKPNHILGEMAEAQRIWRENADHIIPAFTPILLAQMYAANHVLLVNTQIPFDPVESLRARFEDLCRQHGRSLRGAYGLALLIADRRGDRAQGERYFRLALGEPEDPYTPFGPERFISYLADNGDDEAAAHFLNGVDFDQLKYADLVWSAAFLPLARLGRFEQAERAYRDSLDLDEISGEGHRALYLAMTGRPDEALSILPAIVASDPEAVAVPLEIGETRMQLAAALRFLQAAGRGAERPDGMGGASIDELVDEYRATAEKYARQVDEVNGQDVAVPYLYRFWQRHAPAV